jgi:hypothetical protein
MTTEHRQLAARLDVWWKRLCSGSALPNHVPSPSTPSPLWISHSFFIFTCARNPDSLAFTVSRSSLFDPHMHILQKC